MRCGVVTQIRWSWPWMPWWQALIPQETPAPCLPACQQPDKQENSSRNKKQSWVTEKWLHSCWMSWSIWGRCQVSAKCSGCVGGLVGFRRKRHCLLWIPDSQGTKNCTPCAIQAGEDFWASAIYAWKIPEGMSSATYCHHLRMYLGHGPGCIAFCKRFIELELQILT